MKRYKKQFAIFFSSISIYLLGQNQEDDLEFEFSNTDIQTEELIATKDDLSKVYAFQFSSLRYKIKGFDTNEQFIYFDDILMNNLSTQRPNWSTWGGLNPVLKQNQYFHFGDYEKGNSGISNTQSFLLNPMEKKSGFQFVNSFTNRSYSYRSILMFKEKWKQWHFNVAGSIRYAKEGYFEGTNYKAIAMYLGIGKKWDKSNFHFHLFYAPTKRAKSSPNTKEVYDLTYPEYNAYWGFQSGIKRNARIKATNLPFGILKYEKALDDENDISINAFVQLGSEGNTRLGYYGLTNPDPTYYSNLPSYFLRNIGDENYENAFISSYNWQHDEKFRQLHWDNFYYINGNRDSALYYLLEDRTEMENGMTNVIWNREGEYFKYNLKAQFRIESTLNYAMMKDLLGASFFLDKNPYVKQVISDSDLNHPNRKVKNGDAFNYKYDLTHSEYSFSGFIGYKRGKIKSNLFLEFGSLSIQREGKFRNAIYSDNSFGKSNQVRFTKIATGLNFKYFFNGRNKLGAHFVYKEIPPLSNSIFTNIQYSNQQLGDLKNSKTIGVQLKYSYIGKFLEAKLSTYGFNITGENKASKFYTQGLSIRNVEEPEDSYFVNQVVSNLNRRNIGFELDCKYKLTSSLNLIGVLAYGDYRYTNNPDLILSSDYFNAINYGSSYLKNRRVGGSPQEVYHLGLNYSDSDYWWIGIGANFFRENYVMISPISRTSNFYYDTSIGDLARDLDMEKVKEFWKNERLENLFLLNITGGKSWYFNKNSLSLFVNINNVLNTNYFTSGFEQSRYSNYTRFNENSERQLPLFGNRYWSGMALNYFINLTYKF